ncbi:hypothetical protein [Chryseobacterium sp. JUb7]|uniref:hypothetical protein n=1 Tax=Chryseobacterium sp. JUb7 TaxID=2940599 RepID=UPI00216A6EF2|nr:hypothetical protein [Chryseobacterium sp. JUb7]MCS3532503.1 hypothetical protein [Chryseobacterium sp. JUb7]
MKFFLLSLIMLCFYSCTSFSRYSTDTKEVKCDNEKRYICFTNEALHWNYQSFGAMKIANTKQQFDKIKVKKTPKFKEVLLYGQSWNFEGDFYILLNNKKTSEDYIFKDTLINGNKITIVLSKKVTHDINKSFLLNGLK